ncbi:polysaccharide biosynthesis C-terminal domain-containing protein [Acidaminococcus sp. DS4831]|uniref:lipopolysaccharide biosynthesis protein n=1 Tax=Acidaminococcus sp. DS4831 TaxID=3141399 RepID=UPI0032E4D086
MGKYKYLVKNIGLLAVSNFTTKILTFFLVPLYTAVLSTTDYGIYDLFFTTIGVLLPIVTLNIQEGVLRYALDKEFDQEAVVTIGFRYLLIGTLIVGVGILINDAFSLNAILEQYGIYFWLIFVAQALSGMVTFYTRGIGHVRDLSVTSVITSAVTITLNIVFLLVYKWGLKGYFLANILGPLAQCVYLIFRGQMLQRTHWLKAYSAESRLLVLYSLPLIANSLAWWVNNSSDRYIVIFFCGMAANGIYSVASKIPSILTVFQTIFSQAWTLSAVQDFDPEDSKGFFANTYRGYNCLMTVICSLLIVLDKPLAKFLYAKDFYKAWQYVPWLTIAVLFGSMAGYIGGIFVAVRNSRIFASSTLVGAVLNIILNLITVPLIGPLGAAVSTTISYALVWVIRLTQSRKYIKMRIHLMRDVSSYIILVIQAIGILLITDMWPSILFLMGTFFMILLLYIPDVRIVIERIRHR